MPSDLPPDPWGICRCRPKRPPSSAPRLAAFVSSIRGRGTLPGAIRLTAALWGGHYGRSIPLSVEQARFLADELRAHADALDGDDAGRTAAPADRAHRVVPADPAQPSHRYYRPRQRVRPVRPVGSPDMAPQRGEARVATRTSQTNGAMTAHRGSGRS